MTRSKKYLFLTNSTPNDSLYCEILASDVNSDIHYLDFPDNVANIEKQENEKFEKTTQSFPFDYTSYKKFTHCPLSFKYSNCYGFCPCISSPNTGRGVQMHLFIELIVEHLKNLSLNEKENIDYEKIIDEIVDNNLKLPYSSTKNLEFQKKIIKKVLKQDKILELLKSYNQLQIEKKIEIPFYFTTDTYEFDSILKGSIDCIKDNTLIIDFKTADIDAEGEIETGQLDIYQHGYEANTGIEINSGYILNIDKNVQSETKYLCKENYKHIENEIKKCIMKIIDDIYTPTCNKEHCLKCPFRDICNGNN